MSAEPGWKDTVVEVVPREFVLAVTPDEHSPEPTPPSGGRRRSKRSPHPPPVSMGSYEFR